jgi:acetoin utilization protein AcuB
MNPLTVSDLMTLRPRTVYPDTALGDVLQALREDCCRQLPVVDDTGNLVGIITDRDVRLAMNSPFILHEKWQDTALLENMTAEVCMTPDPISIRPSAPAYLAAEMLNTYKFGALPVVDNRMLVGIISTSDFLDYFIETEKPAQAFIDLEAAT